MSDESFVFPPLGDTGKGLVQNVGKSGDLFWQPDVEGFKWTYYVTLQADRPACAFRCHYPHDGSATANSSSPCDQPTALRFIEWAKAKVAAVVRARQIIATVREQGFKDGAAGFTDAQIWQAVLDTRSGHPDVVAVHLVSQVIDDRTPAEADGRGL